MKITSTAGASPTKNMIRQADSGLIPSSCPLICSQPSPMKISAAVQLPTAESACISESVNGRAGAGIVSASNATAAANTPPTPSPVMKR
jgi:hypothetical protein